MSQLDRALIVVAIGYGFHAGYSIRLGDEEDGSKNLHREYMNEQAGRANGSPATTSGR